MARFRRSYRAQLVGLVIVLALVVALAGMARRSRTAPIAGTAARRPRAGRVRGRARRRRRHVPVAQSRPRAAAGNRLPRDRARRHAGRPARARKRRHSRRSSFATQSTAFASKSTASRATITADGSRSCGAAIGCLTTSLSAPVWLGRCFGTITARRRRIGCGVRNLRPSAGRGLWATAERD